MNINRTQRRLRAQGGFTLVELMVVIAIIAALAAIVGVNVIGALDKANVTEAKAQINNFKSALLAYKIDHKKFPSTGEGLDALINNEKGKSYLDAEAIPKDPWDNEYIYTAESGSEYEIISYGGDGQPGGEGLNADVSSKNLRGDE